MMKSTLPVVAITLILMLGCFYSALSQRPGGGERPSIGRVYGEVKDAKTRKPIEFATVSLLTMRDSLPVDGSITNNRGRFDIQEIKAGEYLVVIDFIGYKSKSFPGIRLTPKSPEHDFGTIMLEPSVYNLQQAEIVEEQQFMEIEIDRKVFKVEENITSEGGSANEVLENVPSVEVDMDGNVSLRGSENVTILINGRPSGLTGAGRQSLLEQIPASSIEQVEVLTNPSAKYDPDGMSGIINIILKKNRLEGIHGNAKVTLATGDNYNASLGLNYRNEKFNVFSNYSFRYSDRFSYGTTYRTSFLDDATSILDQQQDGSSIRSSQSLNLGADFFLSPKSTWGISAVYGPRKNEGQDSILYYTYDGNQQLEDFYRRDNESYSKSRSLDLGTDFRKEFTNRDHFLQINGNWSMYRDDGESDFLQSYYDTDLQPSDSLPQMEYVLDYTNSEVITVSADYEQPIREEGRLQIGAKSIVRNIDNDLYAVVFDHELGFSVNDTTRSNRFVYDEQIHALYAIYGEQFGQWGVQAGLRAETVKTQSHLITTDTIFKNDYTSLFPSAHLSYEMSEGKTFQVSYSRRIDRPHTRQLNPFPSYSDPLNLRIGNPFLLPEYINSYELSYAHQWKRNTITSSLYYRQVNDLISRFKTLDSLGVSTTTYRNFSSMESFGAELIAFVKLNKWWSVNGSVNAFQSRQSAEQIEGDLNTTAVGWSGKLMSTMKFQKGLEVQFSGRYRAPRIILQGEMSGMYWLDLAVQKSILDRKGSISLRVSDILNTREFSFYTFGPGFEQESLRKRESQNVYLTFSYRFGKLEEKGSRGRGQRGGGFDDGGGDGMEID